MDCLFCKIISGEIPSMTVYEDDIVKCFLDINPTTNGNTLIVPKKHYKDFLSVPEEVNRHIDSIIKKLYPIYQEKLHCDGLTICHNLDYGQEIKHYHVHFIPRYTDDEIEHISNKDQLLPLEEIYKKIKND